MENWGLITYRTVLVLFDPEKSSARARQNITYVIGHELAHQWFGNIVTMAWWTGDSRMLDAPRDDPLTPFSLRPLAQRRLRDLRRLARRRSSVPRLERLDYVHFGRSPEGTGAGRAEVVASRRGADQRGLGDLADFRCDQVGRSALLTALRNLYVTSA